MPGTSRQFFITLEELGAFVAGAMAEYHLEVELECLFPKVSYSIRFGENVARAITKYKPGRVWLLIPRGSGRGEPQRFCLGVGIRQGKVLTDTHAFMRTDDKGAFRIGRRLAMSLKRLASVDTWCYNTERNGASPSKLLKMTPGAAEGVRSGKLVLQQVPGGPTIFVPHDPSGLSAESTTSGGTRRHLVN